MKTRLDESGRVEIPKQIREEFGLRPGDVLEVEYDEKSIRLRTESDRAGWRRKEGLLVFTGRIDEDLDQLIREQREERARRIRHGSAK